MCGFGDEIRFDGRAPDQQTVRRMSPCIESRRRFLDGAVAWITAHLT